MENLYFIEIGTYSRAGNLTVSHSFAVSSEYPHNTTLAIYQKRYKGFGVKATKIEQLEVAKEAEKQTGKSEAEIQLEKRVKELEKGAGTRFDFQKEWDDFSVDIQLEYKEMRDMYKAYDKKMTRVKELMMAEVKSKFGSVAKSVECVVCPDGHGERYFKCVVNLTGKLY